jgi:predicted glutamine amidotransferase
MCRLLGLTAGTARITATFWLLDAPDSLVVESHRNTDGSGIGFFDEAGAPVLDKQPEAAYADNEFIREAKRAHSQTFVSHVRWATAGGRTVQNTHPFAMAGRIMAHNGGFGEIDRLDEQLGEYRDLVQGDTDSERYFALITQQADVHGGDVGAGITAAARWIAANLPVTALNVVVAMPGELWALRYPDPHALHILQRPAARPPAARPQPGATPMHLRSSISTVDVPAVEAAVIIASEELDGEDGWRMLKPGELVHVRPDLTVDSRIAIPEKPARFVPITVQNPNIDT